ncbi:MAG: cytochrome P450 [Gammaproteobacteria bacterium]|nr:cytochrome P450 [Gammaproteobacteria bacterium]
MRGTEVIGANGVAIPQGTHGNAGFRTYEVHQRERVGQSTEKIKPIQLVSPEFARDPYPLLEILRENYPCYRDWLGNCYWVTRYNDVTSIFADDANFETRPKRWMLGLENGGRDLGGEVPVLTAIANAVDGNAERLARQAVAGFAGRGRADLAIEFAARFALELLLAVLDLPTRDADTFSALYLAMKRGVTWEPRLRQQGLEAAGELTEYFGPLLEQRRADPGEDLVSAVAALELDEGPGSAQDLVVTLLELDFDTLHGTLANLWLRLLENPEKLQSVRDEPRFLKLAVLETFRHSTPVLQALRFARHEVERFGRLIPEGGLVICSAAAGNRDPRIFKNPDEFIVNRKDLCHREARGQYRADGLATGITFGLGPPTRHPAIPEDRPRSAFAITRDTAVTASAVLMDALDGLELEPGAAPFLSCRRIGEMHTCWHLPVRFRAA